MHRRQHSPATLRPPSPTRSKLTAEAVNLGGRARSMSPVGLPGDGPLGSPEAGQGLVPTLLAVHGDVQEWKLRQPGDG